VTHPTRVGRRRAIHRQARIHVQGALSQDAEPALCAFPSEAFAGIRVDVGSIED
jgi:hypothetical protein